MPKCIFSDIATCIIFQMLLLHGLMYHITKYYACKQEVKIYQTYLQGARLRLNIKTTANNAVFFAGVNETFFFKFSFYKNNNDRLSYKFS